MFNKSHSRYKFLKNLKHHLTVYISAWAEINSENHERAEGVRAGGAMELREIIKGHEALLNRCGYEDGLGIILRGSWENGADHSWHDVEAAQVHHVPFEQAGID